MTFIKIEDLKARGVQKINSFELLYQGKIFVKSLSLSKRLQDVAINIEQEEIAAGRSCLIIESDFEWIVWKQLPEQKESNTLSEITQAEIAKKESPPEFAKTSVLLTGEFITRCQEELTNYIGPIAAYILDDILDANPHLSPWELTELLMAEIPDLKKREQFKKSLQ